MFTVKYLNYHGYYIIYNDFGLYAVNMYLKYDISILNFNKKIESYDINRIRGNVYFEYEKDALDFIDWLECEILLKKLLE